MFMDMAEIMDNIGNIYCVILQYSNAIKSY